MALEEAVKAAGEQARAAAEEHASAQAQAVQKIMDTMLPLEVV